MKKQILSEEFRKMQKLAGIITEENHSVSDEKYTEMDNLVNPNDETSDDYHNFIDYAINIMEDLEDLEDFETQDGFNYLEYLLKTKPEDLNKDSEMFKKMDKDNYKMFISSAKNIMNILNTKYSPEDIMYYLITRLETEV